MKRRNRRIFGAAFAGTLLVLSLMAGLSDTDVVCRHMTFADGQTLYCTCLRPLTAKERAVGKFADLCYNQFVKNLCPEALED